MQTLPLSTLLTGVVLSFASGAGTAWFFHASEPASDQHSASAPAAAQPATGRPADMSQFAALWSQTGPSTHDMSSRPGTQASMKPATPGEEQKLLNMVHSDPAVLAKLIQRYGSESNPQTKEILKSVLSSVQAPEVLALSTRLATSGNAAQRSEGFELLQHAPNASPEVRSIIKQALASEQSPTVLVQALAALKPAVVEPMESNAIVVQLQGLAQHADPAVRSQSMLQLAQWDKNGASTERLAQALSDPAGEVREAAVSALAQSGVRSDTAKTALLGILNNVYESKEMKSSALQALERFPLNREEYASYARARSQIGL